MRLNFRRGFTLIEMLVVIGIICVLIGMLMMVTSKALSSARRSRALGDMQTISVGMNAYIADCGDVPRVTWAGIAGCAQSNGDWGSWILCAALLGPQGTVLPAPLGSDIGSGTDGHDGWGFCMHSGGGRVYGPYLQPDQFKIQMQGANPDGSRQFNTYGNYEILDRFGTGILYFPANAHFTAAQLSYVAPVSPKPYIAVYVGNSDFDSCTAGTTYPTLHSEGYSTAYAVPKNTNVFMYEYGIGVTSFGSNQTGLHKMRAMFGDYNYNGAIDPGTNETPLYTGRYILYSAGPDKQCGPDFDPNPNPYKPSDVANCDDIIFSGDW